MLSGKADDDDGDGDHEDATNTAAAPIIPIETAFAEGSASCTTLHTGSSIAIPRKCLCCGGHEDQMVLQQHPTEHPYVSETCDTSPVLHCPKTEPAVVRVCQACYNIKFNQCKHAKHGNLGLFRLSLDEPWKNCRILRENPAAAPAGSATSVSTAAAALIGNVSDRPDWFIAFEAVTSLKRLAHKDGAGVLGISCKKCLRKAASCGGLEKICAKCIALITKTITEREKVRTKVEAHKFGCHTVFNILNYLIVLF